MNVEPKVVCATQVIEISPGFVPPVVCGSSGTASPESVFVSDADALWYSGVVAVPSSLSCIAARSCTS